MINRIYTSVDAINEDFQKQLEDGKVAIDKEFARVQKTHTDEVAILHRDYSAKRLEIHAKDGSDLRKLEEEERRRISEVRKDIQSRKAKLSSEIIKSLEAVNEGANAALKPHNDAIAEATKTRETRLAELTKELETARSQEIVDLKSREDKKKSDSGPLGEVANPQG